MLQITDIFTDSGDPAQKKTRFKVNIDKLHLVFRISCDKPETIYIWAACNSWLDNSVNFVRKLTYNLSAGNWGIWFDFNNTPVELFSKSGPYRFQIVVCTNSELVASKEHFIYAERIL